MAVGKSIYVWKKRKEADVTGVNVTIRDGKTQQFNTSDHKIE